MYVLKKSSAVPPSGTPFWASNSISNWRLSVSTAIVEFTLASNHARLADFRRALQFDLQEDVPNELDQAFVYSTVRRGALQFVSPTVLRIFSATHSEDIAFWKAKLEVLRRCGFELSDVSARPAALESNPFQNSHGGQLIGLGVDAPLGRQIDVSLMAVTLASQKKFLVVYDPVKSPTLRLTLHIRERKLICQIDAAGKAVFLTGPPLDLAATELLLEMLVCFARDNNVCPPINNAVLQAAYYSALKNQQIDS